MITDYLLFLKRLFMSLKRKFNSEIRENKMYSEIGVYISYNRFKKIRLTLRLKRMSKL